MINIPFLQKQDSTLWSLLAMNLITLGVALVEGWSLFFLLWVYWGQSVIIGIFHFAKLRAAKKKPTTLLKMFTRISPWFFLVHYGFFHLTYFVFLLTYSITGFGMGTELLAGNVLSELIPILFVLGGFFANHWYSYKKNLEQDLKKGVSFFQPYARIFPMHFIIIFGMLLPSNTTVVVTFILLKTFFDVIGHGIIHLHKKAKKAFFEHGPRILEDVEKALTDRDPKAPKK